MQHEHSDAEKLTVEEAQWVRGIAERWVNGATAEDRETVVPTECEQHHGVMPEWACLACVRAPLEERIRNLEDNLRFTFSEMFESEAENERLRELLEAARESK